MKAVTWLGRRDVAVADVPDPRIDEPTDAIIKITSTNICGSDLHLYETIGASMSPGDVLGHESLGVVLEVGSKVTTIKPGDRVVIPFQHSPAEWTAVAAEADVVSDRLLAASAEGVPVLVTGPPEGTVLVLADRCTHRGAPLHDGELRCGCIVCPWHGSEFALDGSVVRGPATRPQAAYETQVVDGRVFVRRADEPRSLRTNPVS